MSERDVDVVILVDCTREYWEGKWMAVVVVVVCIPVLLEKAPKLFGSLNFFESSVSVVDHTLGLATAHFQSVLFVGITTQGPFASPFLSATFHVFFMDSSAVS